MKIKEIVKRNDFCTSERFVEIDVIELQGSKIQIKWAEIIREKAITNTFGLIKLTEERLKNNVFAGVKNEDKLRKQTHIMLDFFKKSFEEYKEIEDASIIIKKRGDYTFGNDFFETNTAIGCFAIPNAIIEELKKVK